MRSRKERFSLTGMRLQGVEVNISGTGVSGFAEEGSDSQYILQEDNTRILQETNFFILKETF